MTDLNEKNIDENKASEEEYEYVEFSKVVKPYKDRIMEVIGQHDIVFLCLLIAIGSIVLSLLFRNGNLILTIVVISALGVFFAFGLYAAWQEKKKAEHEYEKAKAIYDELQKQMQKQGEEVDDDGDEE